MADDPGHKAMLYFLEVLMNSNGPLTISQIAGRFGSRNFSAEMRAAAGCNENGLKKFLLKYPSLFTVDGNMVSLFDSSKPQPSTTPNASVGVGSGGITPSGRALPDVSVELEAVRFFQNKLYKKDERWVQIRSLAGHLSQANAEVRDAVGPQLEFRNWLLKHPHIFEVQGELVGLRDGIAAVTAPAFTRPISNGIEFGDRVIPPKTPPSNRKFPVGKSPSSIRRSKSFSERSMNVPGKDVEPDSLPLMAPSTSGSRRRDPPSTMTASEYKAVMFLKELIETEGGKIEIHNVTGHFPSASEGVRNTIGWSKDDVLNFIQKNATIFQVDADDIVTVLPNAKVNAVITGSRPTTSDGQANHSGSGKIYHVAKLWGIIDLGKHEHVFFDKSIMKPPIDDLQKYFKVGEVLHFQAILAQKGSRAKWRATHVWKEQDGMDSDFSDGLPMLSPTVSIEEEMNKFLPFDYDSDSSSDSFSLSNKDNKTAGIKNRNAWQIGKEDINSFSPDGTTDSDSSPTHKAKTIMNELPSNVTSPGGANDPPTMTREELLNLSQPPPLKSRTRPLSASLRPVTRGRGKNVSPSSQNKAAPRFVEVGCQTISTGDIIATQLYQEER